MPDTFAALDRLLWTLERGKDVGWVLGDFCLGEPAFSVDAVLNRMRAIRRDLVELDLYRLHFGDLPPELHVRDDGTAPPLAQSVHGASHV